MKILVGGAGHGGLIAAAKLAKSGFEVTVIEKRRRDELGYDWEDRFTFSVLTDLLEIDEIPSEHWHYRGDCSFVSPDFGTSVVINYDESNRQKVMWRKPLINMLIDYAEKCGVKLQFETAVKEAIVRENRVVGISTAKGDYYADLVIDACGVYSPILKKLPESFGIEKSDERGNVFYAYRAYFNKTADENPSVPFEVYLCHAREQGLSWCCTNSDSVDILIGRIDPLEKKTVDRFIDDFRKKHSWIGNEILHGGNYAIIPVRRPLGLMVANGYAAVGDSAFMTTPMNGMGIDLSLSAGALLAKTVIAENSADAEALWKYNRDFHKLYGANTAKNECLKNSLLNLPGKGVDFLFENKIIQASDLAGAGGNTSLSVLLGKFVRGMKKPKYFFAILGGIIKGSKMSKAYASAPETYDSIEVAKWQAEISKYKIPVTRND